jgi:hypothetical protein
MSLSRYKNTAEILNSTKPISAKFFTNAQIKLLSPTVFYPNIDSEKFISRGSAYSNQKVEFHAYSFDGAYIAGNPFTTNYQSVGDEDIFFDVQQDFNELGLLSGNYKFVYNTVYDRVGSFSTERLFVFDISNSRTEIILKLENPDSQDSLKELQDFFKYWLSQTKYFINSYINFGRNNLIAIANIATDRTQNTIYIKLFEPLPANINVQDSCWITELLSSPYVDGIQIIPALTERSSTTLNEPNFDVEKLYWRHFETEYKNWTDLTATNVDLNEVVTSNFFRKKFGIKLNIDFSDINNFIFYSSLEERLLNFIYKVELISWYQDQIDAIAALSGVYDGDLLVYSNSKRTIINSFDDLEVFLYYGNNTPTSEGSSYKIPPVTKTIATDDLSAIRWISWAQTWVNAMVIWRVAATATSTFAVIDVDSQEWAEWKESVLATAKEFDLQNEAELIKTIPDFIRDDPNNSQYLLFVNMIAHYYDTIWLYVKQFNERYAKQEHPDLGISKDLIGGIIKNLGWTLNESQKFKDLWFYLFGLDDANKLTRTQLPTEYALSGKDYTKALWKRILLNLPRITKTKGTYRSISALLSAYGIPASDFFVREFGGPSNTDVRPKYQEEKLVSYVQIQKNQGITFPYTQLSASKGESVYPNSMYFRFIPDTQTFQSGSTLIFSKNDKIKIFFEKSGSNEYTGNIKLQLSSSAGIASSSISNIEYIEEIPTAIFLQTSNYISSSSETDTLNLYFLQKKYEKVKLFESTSISLSGSFTETLISSGSLSLFNHPSSSYNFNEFRYWKNPINVEIMESHMLSPLSYHGDDIYESTENLLARYSAWVYKAYVTGSTTASLMPYNISNTNRNADYYATTNFMVHPTASFIFQDEFVKFEIPTIAGNGIIPEKERLETMLVSPNLSTEVRSEFSTNDFKENDLNKIKIGYSPQFNINEDIFNRFGTFELDEFIGSTVDYNKKYYSSLFDLAEFYYKNSITTDDIHGYLKSLKIYDFSIFDQIRQVIPAKANAIMGIIIENNELQRLKLKLSPEITAKLQESDKIELLRSSTKTMIFNPIVDGSIKPTQDVQIELDVTPVGNITNIPDIQNSFTKLNTQLQINTKISSVLSSKSEYNSSIRISGLFGNQTVNKNKTKRISTFNNVISYNLITQSYSSPSFGGQSGYETIDLIEDNQLPTIATSPIVKGYYGELVYTYPSDISASVQNFTSAEIKFGNNQNFVKRINKGAENHRYLGSKLIASSVNSITLQNPSENLAFAILSIPSGSGSILLNSLIPSSYLQSAIDPNAQPPGV